MALVTSVTFQNFILVRQLVNTAVCSFVGIVLSLANRKTLTGSAYVGFEEFDKTRSGFFLALNTLAVHIVFALTLPLLATGVVDKADPESGFENHTLKATILGFCTIQTFRTIAITTFVALERRHLMVWAIFAPKYAFDAVLLLATQCLCTCTWLLSKRGNS